MRLASFLLALAMGIGAPGLGDLAVPAKTAHALTSGVALVIAPTNAGILQPGQDLQLTGTLSNGTGTSIGASTAIVSLTRSAMKTRSALTDWLSPDADDDSAAGSEILTAATPAVPAGEAKSISFSVPAAAIGIDAATSTWGVRALSVRIGAGADPIASARSSVVWYPGASFQRTRLAIAVPITVPATTTGLIGADALAEYTAPGGILTQQLDDAIDRKVALAIDPMIIASIGILGNTTPPEAKAWLERLRAASNDTFALSYADSDISLSSQAGQTTIPAPTTFTIDPKLFPSQPTTPTPTATPTGAPGGGASPPPTTPPTAPPADEQALPTSETLLNWPYTLTAVAWPRDDSVVAADLAKFAASGLTTTIISSNNVSFGDLDYTPAASASIDGYPALVSDSGISALLRKAVLAPTEQEWREAVAEFSAAVAIVTSQRPGEARTLLATMGRGYPSNSPRLTETLNALGGVPWLDTATLSDAIAAAPLTATVVNKAEAADRVSGAAALFVAERSVAAFSTVVTDPTLLSGPSRLNLLATLSNSWVGSPAGWESAFSTYLKWSTKTTKSVKIVDSSKIFQPADKIALPITVRNDLDFPVEVVIMVRSPRGILKVVDPLVDLAIEPHSQSGARVAVQSVANGDVLVNVSITSKTGVKISDPSLVEVNVQAGWETVITVVIAVLIFGVFGFGIWRNISKRRKAAKARRDGGTPDDAPTSAGDASAGDTSAGDAPAVGNTSDADELRG